MAQENEFSPTLTAGLKLLIRELEDELLERGDDPREFFYALPEDPRAMYGEVLRYLRRPTRSGAAAKVLQHPALLAGAAPVDELDKPTRPALAGRFLARGALGMGLAISLLAVLVSGAVTGQAPDVAFLTAVFAFAAVYLSKTSPRTAGFFALVGGAFGESLLRLSWPEFPSLHLTGAATLYSWSALWNLGAEPARRWSRALLAGGTGGALLVWIAQFVGYKGTLWAALFLVAVMWTTHKALETKAWRNPYLRVILVGFTPLAAEVGASFFFPIWEYGSTPATLINLWLASAPIGAILLSYRARSLDTRTPEGARR